jgi:nucleoside-diphosphate kinase
MEHTLTFGMVKPSILHAKQLGAIISAIEQDEFTIVGLRYHQLTLQEARAFYAVHKERPFYEELCQYMSSGPVVAMCLEKQEAVASFRKLIGATNPAQAEEGTIRQRFGESVMENAIHGSDSEENAEQEIAFFFNDSAL